MTFPRDDSRAPYGARGLKCFRPKYEIGDMMSRPVWGAWIEMELVSISTISAPRRAPYGARGLKYRLISSQEWPLSRRAPYGARGLKFQLHSAAVPIRHVAPRMGRVD